MLINRLSTALLPFPRALLCDFMQCQKWVYPFFLAEWHKLRSFLEASPFFATVEIISSSLLFTYDAEDESASRANLKMIDFAKTFPFPAVGEVQCVEFGSDNCGETSHREPWVFGNHEDQYLNGLDNLIQLFESIDVEAWV